MVKIRDAVEADIPALVIMGHAFHKESQRYRSLIFAADKVAAMIRGSITGTLTTLPVGGALVAEKDGTIVGFMGGFVAEPWFSREKLAIDYAFYVAPDHRGGRVGAMLIQAFERWARDQGVIECSPAVSSGITADRTIGLYERLGYESFRGATMVKRFDNGL